MVVCCCDGTVDGILTAVFEAWRINPSDTRINIGHEGNLEWFAEYTDVETQADKAARVAAAVVKKISAYAYEMVYDACISTAPDRGDVVLQFIRKGFTIGSAVTEDMHDHNVTRVFELSRNVNFELCHYRGFLRFRQQGEYLLGRFEPKNDLLTLMADHFTDRLMQENFAIIDMNRGRAAIHRAYNADNLPANIRAVPNDGNSYYVTDVEPKVIEALKYNDEEEEIRQLWEVFEKSIAIEPRRNIRLQQQNMPLRFRGYMDIRK